MRELVIIILQQHFAPRVIQVSGFCSKPVSLYKSILPGCKHALALTRTFLQKFMQRIVGKHIAVDTRVHVDDTAIFVAAPVQSEVQDAIAPCISDLAGGVRELKLELTKKESLRLPVDMAKRFKHQFRTSG